MRAPPRDAWQRAATLMALICAFLSAGVFVRRGLAAWEAAGVAPGLAITSGCEEESFLSVWRAVHHQEAYADAAHVPYAATYFNWLFYAGYAVPVRSAVNRWGDAIIPRAGRIVTAVSALLGTSALFWLLWRALPQEAGLAAGLAAFAFGGPLVGWWAHTLRPDVCALAAETAALAVLVAGWRQRPGVAVLGATLLFFAAWSCKQTNVLGLGTALLFLLGRRQWRLASILMLGSVCLWGGTLLALGPDYRASLLSSGRNSVFILGEGLANLRDMLQKTAPFWLMGILLGCRRARASVTTPAGLPADLRLLGLLGLLVAMPAAFAAGCKLGAYSNYYFTPMVMLTCLVAGLIAIGSPSRLVFAGFTLAAGMQLLVAVARVGQMSQLPQAAGLAEIWAVWQPEPEPRFAAVNALNLPWLNPGSPPFVLAYNYGSDRAAGRSFEADGIGGLIRTGYFRSLLLPAATGQAYDGGDLRQYTRGRSVKGLTVFNRDDHPPP